MAKIASSLASCWRSWANTCQQHGEVERLGDVIVGARFQAENGVRIGVVAGQHDDRRLEAVLAQNAYRLATVDVRQPYIHDHQVDLPGLGGLNAFDAIFRGHRFELLMQRELLG
jgi:hypothetical protein